jgi:hypothetical protein
MATPDTRPEQGGIPDFGWINKNLAIAEVAGALGLKVGTNGLIHCWHPDKHQFGDRTASVAIRQTNNTAKCFGNGCGVGPFGPIDLVRDVLGFDSPLEAGVWIAERFPVRCVKARKHLEQPRRLILRAGFEGVFGLLVQSGVWARLLPATRSIIPVLLTFAERDPGKTTYRLTMSYRAISRYSGIKSPNAIKAALKELEELGWLRHASARIQNVLRETTMFELTPESDAVSEHANMLARQTRDEIQAERDLRKKQRTDRLSTPRPLVPPASSQSCTSEDPRSFKIPNQKPSVKPQTKRQF